MPPSKVTVQVVSDTVCPFCMLGKLPPMGSLASWFQAITTSVCSLTPDGISVAGKRRLETAIRMLHVTTLHRIYFAAAPIPRSLLSSHHGLGHVQGQREVEVHWHPFQLNPNAPKEGLNKLNYYKAKFGPERTAQMIPSMTVSDASP